MKPTKLNVIDGPRPNGAPSPEMASVLARLAAVEAELAEIRPLLPNYDILPTELLLYDRCLARREMVTGDRRVSERTAAWLLGITPDSLRNKRRFGDAPPWYRVGGRGSRVTFRLADIARWMDARLES